MVNFAENTKQQSSNTLYACLQRLTERAVRTPISPSNHRNRVISIRKLVISALLDSGPLGLILILMRRSEIILKLLRHLYNSLQMLDLQYHLVFTRSSRLKLRQRYSSLKCIADFSTVPLHGKDVSIGDGVDDGRSVNSDVCFFVEPLEVLLPDFFALIFGESFVM
jgi:hypothetical protein